MAKDKVDPLVKARLDKLEVLREAGVNPYPYTYEKTHNAKEILDKYEGTVAQTKTKDVVSIAGRIMFNRNMGKAGFAHVRDESGTIQIYLSKDNLGDNYIKYKKADIGDWIGVAGTVFTTKKGEITIEVSELEMLCKSTRPLPEKHHGLQDKELRYRKRYLDLIMNPEVRDVFKNYHKILRGIRSYLDDADFTEVTVPYLQTVYGGAEAKPFVTHINAWNMPMYLRIATELHLKRLIVGGFEKVYTIGPNFRNEGVDKSHNPEFTAIEWYEAYVDYNKTMERVEEIFENVALNIHGTTKVKNGEVEVDFKAPWQRLSMKGALKEYAQIDYDKLSDQEVQQQLTAYAITLEGDYDRMSAMQLLFEELCEDKLIQPVHIIDHPNNNPLCKVHRDDETLCERFESYCMGMEISNGYTELNDPVKQREVMAAQAQALRAGFEEAHPMDEDFVESIEVGMPPTSGVGIGIDRMAMILLGQESIRDVILFPTMKPEQSTVEEQKKDRMKPFKDALKE